MGEGHQNAASKIVEARRTGVQLESFEPDECPKTLEEGYAIQAAAISGWHDEVAGWKVGATSQEIQHLFGITEPVYGPIFKECVFDSPASVSAKTFPHRMVETEFAFRFAEDLPSRKEAYTRNEIVASVDALIPAMEIVNPRFKTLATRDIAQVVADFCGNGGVVLGAPLANWRRLVLPSQTVSFAIDGAERQRGSGSIVLGNPLNVLEWFVNALTKRGGSVAAGQFVLTGTMTGLHAPGFGQVARADFGKLGAIEVIFS